MLSSLYAGGTQEEKPGSRRRRCVLLCKEMAVIRRASAVPFHADQSRMAVVVVVLASLALPGVLGCFDGCDCLGNQMRCRGTTLPVIPTSSVSYTTIEFKNNPFASALLSRRNFSGFGEVKSLSIVACGIRHIEALAFSELRKLTWLDLSDNDLGEIDSFAFASIAVSNLFLSRNPRLTLGVRSLEGLNTTGLFLSQCGLRDTLVADALLTLPLRRSLRTLWLDGNGMRSLDGGLAELASGLDTLRINDNPLECDCRLLWLRQSSRVAAMVGDDEQAQPHCASPPPLAGRSLISVSPAELLCAPASLDLSLIADNGGSVTAVCSGQQEALVAATPSAVAAQIVLSRRGDDGSETDAAQGRRDAGRGAVVASLTLLRPSTGGVYRCSSTGSGGNVSVTLNVTGLTRALQLQPTTVAVTNDAAVAGGRGPGVTATSTTPQQQQQQPLQPPARPSHAPLCPPVPVAVDAASAKGVVGGGWTTVATVSAADTDPFLTKYFTLVDLLGTAFGTFAGTLLTCVLVMHFCVYRVRRALPSPRYEAPSSSAQSSDYGAGSFKCYYQPPPLPPPSGGCGRTAGMTPVSTAPSSLGMSCDRRLLPAAPTPMPPLYKHQNPVFDENHYMTTNLEEMEFLNGCQHPPCAACQQSLAHSS